VKVPAARAQSSIKPCGEDTRSGSARRLTVALLADQGLAANPTDEVYRDILAFRIASHTRHGEAGMSRWLMPSGDSASMTAFMTAPSAPTEPASPRQGDIVGVAAGAGDEARTQLILLVDRRRLARNGATSFCTTTTQL
jgi:hypothetical protein